MEIVFTEDEIRACLPPPGHYPVAVASFAASSADARPAQVRIVWVVTDRATRPPIHDVFVLRGAPSVAHPGMRRLLGLLDVAGIAVRPGTPIDLRHLIGFECEIEVAHAMDQSGFPYSRVARYRVLARNGAPRTTTSRACNASTARRADHDQRTAVDEPTRDDAPRATTFHDGGARRRDSRRLRP